VLVTDANCVALMTNATGTNFILATDLSGPLTITQNPTNGAVLPLGTNLVVLTVADASGNKSYSTNRIMVRAQTPPVIVLNGVNPMQVELGAVFTDPGVSYSDTCSGIVSAQTNGVVDSHAISTNTLVYLVTDSGGNSNSVSRVIIVRDTTAPVISWSFTNLVLSLNESCSAVMPDVTGTNFILATDFSGPLQFAQSPTNNSVLVLGTNVVIISVSDAFGNTSYATNFLQVRDTTLPLITSQPQSQTNLAGATVIFSVASASCTPATLQWLFNDLLLTNETNNLLVLTNVNQSVVGNYSVLVTSAAGVSTSMLAKLTVNLLPSSLSLVSPINPDGYLDNLNFTAAVTPTNATGAVQFLTNGTPFDVEPLAAGFATSTNLANLPRGTNLVVAVYSGDGNYFPATNQLWQVTTNHPPQVSSAFYTLVAGLDLNITVPDLATNWSDADGDVLTIASVAASTNGVSLSNTVPVLFYTNPNCVNDQFVCTVRDDFGGTNFQTVTVTVVPQTNAAPNISNVVSQPSGFSLTLKGGYGSTYVLESTADFILGSWEPVATNTLDVTGVWRFTDAQATNFVSRFYRLKLVP
jgi:hypothetical protein